ncbi:Alpha/Beta hydrolase protein [Xylogone sp. PMI_703]|nr:Alpha/Beta hydrolase protein [Xylogone sp. PMI_703]
MAGTPGLLYVTMQPHPDLSFEEFTDWYNNEHGPLRLRLDFVTNGFRYRAIDIDRPENKDKTPDELPEWMALYDCTDVFGMAGDSYTALRKEGIRSQREIDTMARITVDRRVFDSVDTKIPEGFKPVEELDPNQPETSKQGNVMIAVCITLHPGKEKDFNRWLDEEHIDMLSKVPGWFRSRRFITSKLPNSNNRKDDEIEYLTIHEFGPENKIGGDEHRAAQSTPFTKDIMANAVKTFVRRTYKLYYTFGPAPRDLAVLTNKTLKPFESCDKLTRTFPVSSSTPWPAIESFITTSDGVEIPFRLEGNSDPNAPTIVLSNCILVEWGIWDDFVSSFLSNPQNKKYRILRYHTRGRKTIPNSNPVTMDLLADDIIALLDALRIPKAAAVIGVSIGGATTLNVALRYPSRVQSFISCDTSAKAPAGNSKAWIERIGVAEKQGQTLNNEPIVGTELADLTAKRWFVNYAFADGQVTPAAQRVADMVRRNSLPGFTASVKALWEYDMKPLMNAATVRGAFLVGAGDGVLPASMKEAAASYGNTGNTGYIVIDDAGHLPMVEKPAEFTSAVEKFLG